ncbi:MFS transporter, DHA1 family, bicyclomycin/chloramphenicol resistance protein [Halopseudomonas salegens]|uniref:Bcr/CflA family efflux transporter n=1 Tax=Halopseudomonas salegens TaxID=1434072 RepID=A0A1H2HCS7_9GAMM|nr:MFS transporter, DHA1 family, bicyclomycin/chloramphenicol resistance protein [Halopseudomonas salegens]
MSSESPRVLNGSILFLLAGLAAMGSLATNVILPVFPGISLSLGVEPRDLGLTLSSFFIAFAVGQLFVGPLADRFGRKPLVVGGLVTFAAGSALCALSQTLEVLIIGRVVQALGACAASVLARAIARDLFDGEALARALALIMIAMAAAPGFSPLVGTGLGALLGWRFIFAAVGLFALVLGIFYLRSMGETQPSDAKQPLRLRTVLAGYGALACDRRFIYPALSVSLTIGMLYTFFATAPAILISELGLTGLQLALYFAATVFIVFGAGFLAPRLARKLGQARAVMVGALIALSGSLVILALAASPTLLSITAGLGLFLLGMGFLNPLGTAITLQPFAQNAGIASSLLGFLQMACAAIGATAASVLPLPPTTALAATMTAGSGLALLAFIPVIVGLPRARVSAAVAADINN